MLVPEERDSPSLTSLHQKAMMMVMTKRNLGTRVRPESIYLDLFLFIFQGEKESRIKYLPLPDDDRLENGEEERDGETGVTGVMHDRVAKALL